MADNLATTATGFDTFVNNILNELDDEEVGGATSEVEDIDEVSIEDNHENSESEQSAEEMTDNSGDEMDTDDIPVRFFIGKNGHTLWMDQPPPQAVRVRSRNIVPAIHAPGVKTAAGKQATTPIQSWRLFFTDDVLQQIVECTNIKIRQLQPNYSRERDAKETTLSETKAVIGLLYLAGVKKSSHVTLKDLWETDGLGLELFRCVMNLSRFTFLLLAIRFDNILTRDERKEFDRLAPVREMFSQLVENFQKYYSPGHLMTLDEKLEAFRGKCPFRQFIKNKPAKYGLKLFSLVDAKMAYTYNLEIYAGKQPEGPFQVSNSAKDVTLRLIKPIENTGLNLKQVFVYIFEI
ncbi:piggyBac transposable element-derived protein 3-like [Nilaparvata lugens]|uniref:piggyBac transposable element-derived protein 3-like n=1 Tax=Nilaparvata lugens TaxID=108931 RepID=UPI00193D9948|nr:piggyBac transposable element-derived protein 3-like [Nilaparvata lugens]